MECREIQTKLVGLVEGEVSEGVSTRIQAHLSGCGGCREEYEELKAAFGALDRSLPLLSPRQRYLTPERRAALMEQAVPAGRAAPAFSLRRAVAVAAAVAIIVSAGVFYMEFVLLGGLSPETTFSAEGDGTFPATSVAQPPPARTGPVYVVGWPGDMHKRVSVEPVRPARRPLPYGKLIRADSSQVMVPVENVYFDSVESGSWW